MIHVPRPRLRLRHRPILYWSLTAALALTTAWAVARAETRARAAEARWELRTLPVAAVDLAAGVTIGPDDVRTADLPALVVPAGSVPAAEMVGRSVRTDIAAGEVLIESRLAPTGVSGPAALLAADEVGVSVARTVTTPPLAEGDRVDVVVGRDPFGAGLTEVSVAVHGAVVLVVADDAVTLAVPARDAPAVVGATRDGFAELVLSAG
ncbi:MAG: SAF domain-containing protein [Actinomycetota bacterium]|nr:SAF domain-containing protein [Actinomycetota bacterium]